MIEELEANLFRIEVPLPQNPLKSINSYIVRGNERNLMIDTGMNRKECSDVLESSLKKLGVSMSRTDIFVTHFHADHMGLVTHLKSDKTRVYYHQPEADFVALMKKDGYLMEKIDEFARLAGFSEVEIEESLKRHPAFKYGPPHYPEFSILGEGDALDLGEFHFECVQTPGHTAGHMCLYERDKKLLVSGDHILGDITPNISAWADDVNALKDYLDSLDKVSRYDVSLVLPGHRSVFKNLRGRIEELKLHHAKRLDEVRRIVQSEAKTAYRVAAEITWDFAGPWETFPVMQKWFATGEAKTHLRFLEDEGTVTREERGNQTYFISTQ